MLSTAVLQHLLCFAAVLPACFILYLANTYLPFSVGYVSPGRWLVLAVLPVVIASYGLRRKSLDVSGALAGIVIAQLLILANYGFLAQLMCFFVAGSRATKFRAHLKADLEEDYKEGGRRDWRQVVCTGGVAVVVGCVYLVECGSGEFHMDLHHHFHHTILTAAMLGSLSCAAGDTFSSEFGSVLGRGMPRLVTSFAPVPRGTNGGLSIAGTAASIVGGFLIGLSHYLVNLALLPAALTPTTPTTPQHCLLWLGAVGGLLGSLIDSLLGATLQYSGVNSDGQVVGAPGVGVRHICGRAWLSNHSVNLLSGALTAFILPALLLCVY